MENFKAVLTTLLLICIRRPTSKGGPRPAVDGLGSGMLQSVLQHLMNPWAHHASRLFRSLCPSHSQIPSLHLLLARRPMQTSLLERPSVSRRGRRHSKILIGSSPTRKKHLRAAHQKQSRGLGLAAKRLCRNRVPRRKSSPMYRDQSTRLLPKRQ